MFELKNDQGYVMWSIHGNRVERQCILYNADGSQLDSLDMDDTAFIAHLVQFNRFVSEGLRSAGPVEREIYLKNLPSLLQAAQYYTNVFSM